MNISTTDTQNKLPTQTALEWLKESANKYVSLGDRLRAASVWYLFEYAPDVAEQLANDLHPDVRCNIALHTDVFSNPQIVEKLSNDKLETIAKWDNPSIKGVTGMREYDEQKSEFCNPKTGIKALEEILKKGNFRHLLLSYNDEGIIPKDEILKLFNKYGRCEIAERNYQRYKSNSNGELKNGVKIFCLFLLCQKKPIIFVI